MKLLFSTLLFLISFTSFSQNIAGTWSGQLDFGLRKLPIVFHFVKNSDGIYQATMDSPDQNAKNKPVQQMEYNYPELKLRIPEVGAVFSAKVSGDTLINGTFYQNGNFLTLKLTRGNVVRQRPQEPKPPFPYNATDVTFNSRKSDVILSGTMTYPTVGKKFPAVILVSGSGAQSRDEEMFGHKPFLLLADYLTKKGIAVLRYDDRGVGKSNGNFATATTADFTEDALGAVDYLRNNPNIDKTKIGIIGHSEGGNVAFIAAAAQEPTIAFVVSMAGMAIKGSDLLLKQNEAVLTLQGVPQMYIKQYCSVLKKIYRIVEENTDEEITANKNTITDTLFNKEELLLPESLRQSALLVIPALSESPWLRYMLSSNPAEAIREMGNTPILALYCGKDCQVDADMNIASIRENSNDGKKRNVYHKYNNLNHLFQNCVTGNPSEYTDIEETISEDVLRDIATWIMTLK